MLNNNVFYHAITRKIIVGFGTLFSNIRIERKDAGDLQQQVIAVPIAYAPKEKWLVRIEQDTSLENHTYTSLPRLSFEVTGMSYDPTRKTNRMNYITCGDGLSNNLKKVYAPVPWNIDISLYCLTKTQEDALQIVEQILPYFSPEYTLSIKAVPETNVIVDIPIILESVSIQDDYDGDFNQRRFVTYTINFTLKANFYGPVDDAGIISKTYVDVNNTTPTPEPAMSSYAATGNTSTGEVSSENWTNF
jgi:hypothetical protein